jgi:hypothetical protein
MYWLPFLFVFVVNCIQLSKSGFVDIKKITMDEGGEYL